MSRSFVRHHRWALVATFALLLAGCSSPTAPNLASGPPAPPSNEVTNPTFVTVPVLPDGAAAAMAAGSAPVPVPAPEPEPISDVAVVDGRDGGVFRVGRFTLHVPPGAWDGVADVNLRVPNQAVLECEITISPPTLNRFNAPVTLTMDFFGASNVQPEKLEMLWQCEVPEDSTKWERVEDVEVRGSEIVARIQHFSRYGGSQSKAGW